MIRWGGIFWRFRPSSNRTLTLVHRLTVPSYPKALAGREAGAAAARVGAAGAWTALVPGVHGGDHGGRRLGCLLLDSGPVGTCRMTGVFCLPVFYLRITGNNGVRLCRA